MQKKILALCAKFISLTHDFFSKKAYIFTKFSSNNRKNVEKSENFPKMAKKVFSPKSAKKSKKNQVLSFYFFPRSIYYTENFNYSGR